MCIETNECSTGREKQKSQNVGQLCLSAYIPNGI